MVLGGAALLLALLRGALWLSAVQGPGDAGALLLQFDPAALQAIELRRGDAPEVRLERRGDEWVVASAGGARAHRPSVDDLIGRLWSWRVERRAGSDASHHADYGVDRASARRIRLLGARELNGLEPLLSEVWIGRMTGAAADLARDVNGRLDTKSLGLFVRARRSRTLEEEPSPITYVVNGFAGSVFEAEARRWITRPLVDGAPDEVDALEVRSGGRAGFRIELGPNPVLAGQDQSAPLDGIALRRRLQALYVLRGIGPGPQPPGDAAQLTLIRGALRSELRLWRGGDRWFLAAPGLFSEGERSSLEVSASDAESAAGLCDLEGLVRSRLVTDPLAQASELIWREATVERKLVREGSGWSALKGQLAGPGPAPAPSPALAVSSERVAALLALLEGIPVKSWTPESPGVEAELRVEVELSTPLGAARFGFGERSEERGVAVRSSAFPGYVAWIELEQVARLRLAFAQLVP